MFSVIRVVYEYQLYGRRYGWCYYFHADPESLFPGQQAEGISGRFRAVPFYDGSSVYASSAPWRAWTFSAAGVGEVIAGIVENVVPKGNVNLGIIVFAIGMVLFTMIMGNAFAAITVITVGIGGPFVLAYGADPVVIGMLALTCGYAGHSVHRWQRTSISFQWRS